MGKKSGPYSKVAENLWRYSTSKTYFAIFRHGDRVVWKNLKTTDRDLAKRRMRDELENAGKVDAAAAKKSFGELLDLYDESLERYDGETKASRRSFLKQLRTTWKNGFDIPVGGVTPAHVELWLAPHRQRMKKVSFNEYIRVVKHIFELAVNGKMIAESPAAKLKSLRKESSDRHTPTTEQFQSILGHIRKNRFSDHALSEQDRYKLYDSGLSAGRIVLTSKPLCP